MIREAILQKNEVWLFHLIDGKDVSFIYICRWLKEFCDETIVSDL